MQNPQPQGIPAKVYQGKGFTGVAPAQRRPGIPHPGLARGAGRVAKHELSSDAPQWGWHQRGPIAPPPKPKGSVKKNGGGTEEATPELADVTMIGRTLQSVSDILSEHAKEHHDLDKKKSKKTSFAQRGRALQPGRKPHGQTKPRQQRGTAHGQRIAKHETGEPHDDCETITRRVAKHQTEVNPAHSHGPQGSATSYAARSEAGREQARQESRRRPRQHNSEDEGLQIAREKRRMQKQHPDEYPEEWGPDELYQKIGEKTAEIKKELSRPAARSPKPGMTVHPPKETHGGEHVHALPGMRRYAHEHGPQSHLQGWGQSPDSLAKAREEIGEIQKAVGGCPAGFHKHEPYDYCHPTKRAHRGETRMKPAGGIDDAHGVIDQAMVQAHAIGSKSAMEAFGQVKEALGKLGGDPERAFKALSMWRDVFTQHVRSVSDPRQRMAMSMVADVLGRAAAKVKPKPEEAAHADVQRMDDKQLAKHYDALVDYLKGDQAKQLAPKVHQEYIDRLKAVNAEQGRRSQQHPTSEPSGAEGYKSRYQGKFGSWDTDDLKGYAARVGDDPSSDARARLKEAAEELKRRGGHS